MNQAEMIERIEGLIRERGLNPTRFQKSIGLNSSFFTDAKRSSTTKLDNIVKIATALDVSIDYLVHGEEHKQESVSTYNFSETNPEFAELYSMYRNLSERDQGKVEGYIRALSESHAEDAGNQAKLSG